MIERYFIIFFLTLLLVAGCSKPHPLEPGILPDHMLLYQPEPTPYTTGSNHQAYLVVNGLTDTVTVALRRSARLPAEIDAYYLTELELDNGYRSNPVQVLQATDAGGAYFLLHFLPVYNGQLYQQAQLRGNALPRFRLRLPVQAPSAAAPPVLAFQAPVTAYKYWVATYGHEQHVKQYTLVQEDALAEQIALHLNSQADLPPQTATGHSVSVNSSEILVNGFATNVKAYAMHDSLYVFVRMVNHSPYLAHVTPEQWVITGSQGVQYPTNTPAKAQELKKGHRYQARLSFALPRQAEMLALHTHGLTLNQTSFLATPIVIAPAHQKSGIGLAAQTN